MDYCLEAWAGTSAWGLVHLAAAVVGGDDYIHLDSFLPGEGFVNNTGREEVEAWAGHHHGREVAC